MKKFFYFMIFALVACNSTDDNFGESVNEQSGSQAPPKSLIRSVDDAMIIAQQSLTMLERTTTRTDDGSTRKIDLANGIKTIVSNGTRSDGGGKDTLMYVFNFEDNEGFAIVAAPRCVEGLLAVTESGHYDLDTPSEIAGFEMFMEMAEKYVSEKTRDPIIQLIDSVVCIGHSYVGPYVTVRWGQNRPEGEFCPNRIAGCANTALAQIMSYFQYPQSINLTYPNADKTIQQLNWTAMKAHQTGHTLNNCAVTDSATHGSIGRLCRQLGHMNNSNYNQDMTITSQSDLLACVNTLGYQTNTAWSNYNENAIRTLLNNCKPIIIFGKKPNYTIGHFWVIDGYDTVTYQIYTYAHPVGSLIWWVDSIGESFTEYLYHYNWGWYGLNNGYFNANVFDVSAVQYPDTNNNYATGTYSNNVKFLPVWH